MNKEIYTNRGSDALFNCTVKTIDIRHGNVTVVQAIGGGVHRTTKQPVDCNANGNHAKGNVPKSTKGGALNDLSAEKKLWNVLISILTIFLIIGWIVVVVFMGMVIPPFMVHVRKRSRQYSVKKFVKKFRAKFPSGQISAGAAKVQGAVYGTLRQHLYLFLVLVQITFLGTVVGGFAAFDVWPKASGSLFGSSRQIGTATNLALLFSIVPMGVVGGGLGDLGVGQEPLLYDHGDCLNQESVGMQLYTCDNANGVNSAFLGSSCLHGMSVSGKIVVVFFR